MANAWIDKKTHVLEEDTSRRGSAYGEQPGTREHAQRQTGSTQHGDQHMANNQVHENTHTDRLGAHNTGISTWRIAGYMRTPTSSRSGWRKDTVW